MRRLRQRLANELNNFDERMFVILSGAFRRLTDGVRIIRVFGEREWQASGPFPKGPVEKFIAEPSPGWEELAGAAWL
jgi:hypothetical protein